MQARVEVWGLAIAAELNANGHPITVTVKDLAREYKLRPIDGYALRFKLKDLAREIADALNLFAVTVKYEPAQKGTTYPARFIVEALAPGEVSAAVDDASRLVSLMVKHVKDLRTIIAGQKHFRRNYHFVGIDVLRTMLEEKEALLKSLEVAY